ncbi:MAG: response regulator [Nitrospirae bacterium]|nr:response regulator [Nitrospirota bacterium]
MDKKEFKVLIAEDDEIVRDVIVRAISGDGYSVVVANDGLAAIRLLRLEDIKLVITDLRMPGADGMEVLRNAKRVDPKIAVVVLTAYGTLDTTLQVIKEGAYDYALKPFVIQELLLVVRNAYERAVLIRDNEELSSHLKETYRNLETIRTLGSSNDTVVKLDNVERIERLRKLGIINADEAETLKEKIISGREYIKS